MKEYNLPVYSERTYQNPVSYEGNILPTNPDPFILKYCGYYYCYSTNDQGVKLSVSRDLIHWEFLGFALQEAGRKNFWAPAVFYHDGLFFMYYSNVSESSDDPHDEYLRVAVSETPEGPFVYKETLIEQFSIDPEIVKGRDGKIYMFYSANDITGTDSRNTGTSILVDEMLAYNNLAGRVKGIITPSLSEEIFEYNRFKDGRDWYTIEGASYFEHHNRAYLLYSSNAYVRENYYIGYATGEVQPSIGDIDWKKFPNEFEYFPLVRRNEFVEGTGHNSLTKAPNNVDNWIVYHGRDATQPLDLKKEQRVMRIDPLFFDGSQLMTYAPSYKTQNAPALPNIQDYFDGQSPLDNIQGDASYEENGLRTTADPFLAVYDASYKYYLLECDVAARASHLGRKNGIVAAYHNQSDYVVVLLESGENTVTVRQVKNGIQTTLKQFSVPEIKMNQVYNLKVERSFADYTISVDNVEIGTFVLDNKEARVGICSYYTESLFRYFALTEYVDLFADKMNYMSEFFRCDTEAVVEKNGRLTNYGITPIELFGQVENGSRYALGFAMPSKRSQFSFLFEDGERTIEILFHHTHIDGIIDDQLAFQMNYEANEDKTNTLNMDYVQNQLIFYLKNQTYSLDVADRKALDWTVSFTKGYIESYQQHKIGD